MKDVQHHHYPKKTFIPFIMVFLIGVFLVVLFHPRIWFGLLSDYVNDRITRNLNADLNISNVYGNFNRAVFVDTLNLNNKQGQFNVKVDFLSVHYQNILKLAVTRSVDSLTLINPVFTAAFNNDRNPDTRRDLDLEKILAALPSINIENLIIQNGIYINDNGLNEEYMAQNINGSIHLNFKGGKRILEVRSLSLKPMDQDNEIDITAMTLTHANRLLKIQDLSFNYKDIPVMFSGKLQTNPDLPFKGEMTAQKIRPSRWIPEFEKYPDDIVDVFISISGNPDHIRSDFRIQGVLFDEIIDKLEGSIRYIPPAVEINRLVMKNTLIETVLDRLTYNNRNFTVRLDIQKLNYPFHSPLISDRTVKGEISSSGLFPDSVVVQYHLADYNQNSSDYINGSILYKDQDLILIDTNTVHFMGANLFLLGRVDKLSDFNLRFNLKANDVNSIPLNNKNISINSMNVQGRLKGPVEDPNISLIYLFNNTSYDRYSLLRARGAASVDHIRSEPSGDMYIDFSELYAGSTLFEQGGSFLEFLDDTILISSFSLRSGDNRMELVGKFTLDSTFIIDEFAASLKGNNVRMEHPFHLTIKKDAINSSPLNLTFNDGSLIGQGKWDGKENFNVSLKGQNLDISDLFSIQESYTDFDGKLTFNMSAKGSTEDPDINLQFNIDNFRWDNSTFQQIAGKMTFIDSTLLVDKAEIRQSKFNYINSFGRFPLALSFNDGMEFTLPVNQPFMMTSSFNQFNLESLDRLIGKNLKIRGLTDGIFKAEGFYNDPDMNINLTTQDAGISRFSFNNILSQLSYHDKKVNINTINLKNESGLYSVKGFIPVDLRLQPAGQRISIVDSLFIQIDGNDNKLSLLEPILKVLDNSEGSYSTSVVIRGIPGELEKSGYLKASNGTLTLDNVMNPVTNVNGTIELDNNMLNLSLKGNMIKSDSRFFRIVRPSTPKNNVILTGTINIEEILHPVLDLNLTGNSLYLHTLNDRIEAVGDGDIRLSGRDTLRAEGQFAMKEGLLNFNFRRPVVRIDNPNRTREFEYILEIPIDKNVFLRNDLIDAELEGTIVLEKRAGETQIMSGNLYVRSGKFYYYSAIFDIESGQIVFDPYANNITLDFRAVTPVMNGTNNVIATLTGDIDKPAIELSDERNMFVTQGEIIQLLTTGTVGSGQFVTGAAQNYLEAVFEKELERTASEWGGFNRVDLKTRGSLFENTNLDSVSILLERRIGKDLYLSYEQALNNNNANRNIELEYRLNRNASIISAADDESVSFSYRIRFQY